MDMKKTIVITLLAAAGSLLALDNTVKNDFWDTTGYVNATTSVEASGVNTDQVVTSGFVKTTFFSGVIEFFSSFKNGFRFIFR